MTVQKLPEAAVFFQKPCYKRKRRLKWLLWCSWENSFFRFFLPSSSPRASLDELLASRQGLLVVWKTIELIEGAMEGEIEDAPAADEKLVASMKRRYSGRIVWKQLDKEEWATTEKARR
jgi:hypothetical protein